MSFRSFIVRIYDFIQFLFATAASEIVVFSEKRIDFSLSNDSRSCEQVMIHLLILVRNSANLIVPPITALDEKSRLYASESDLSGASMFDIELASSNRPLRATNISTSYQ